MNRNLDRIEKLLRKDIFDKLLEALEIFGVESPKDCEYNITTRGMKKMAIVPDDYELNKYGHHEIDVIQKNKNNNNIKIIIEWMGFHIIWINKGNLTWEASDFENDFQYVDVWAIYSIKENWYVDFVTFVEGDVTSKIKFVNGFKNEAKNIDTITSTIDNLVLSSTKNHFPISEYYSVFQKVLLENSERLRKDGLGEENIKIILKLYETYINKFLNSLNRKNIRERRRNELNQLYCDKEEVKQTGVGAHTLRR